MDSDAGSDAVEAKHQEPEEDHNEPTPEPRISQHRGSPQQLHLWRLATRAETSDRFDREGCVKVCEEARLVGGFFSLAEVANKIFFEYGIFKRKLHFASLRHFLHFRWGHPNAGVEATARGDGEDGRTVARQTGRWMAINHLPREWSL